MPAYGINPLLFYPYEYFINFEKQNICTGQTPFLTGLRTSFMDRSYYLVLICS